MLKLIHNEEFIFNTPFGFVDRTGKDEYYTGGGDLHMIRPGQHIWETNFVPNLFELELPEWEDRGKGSTNINLAIADGVMHAHISEIAPASYKKAHRHDGGTHVLTLSGGGYSLLWNDGETEFERVEWTFGTVFPPADGQWHQHFVTTNEPSRYVATNFGGIRHPVLQFRRDMVIGKPGEKQLLSKSSKRAGIRSNTRIKIRAFIRFGSRRCARPASRRALSSRARRGIALPGALGKLEPEPIGIARVEFQASRCLRKRG